MKKFLLITLLSVFTLNAQTNSQADGVLVKSIKEKDKKLVLEFKNKNVTLGKKDTIQIFLPTQKDFLFVKKKQSVISAKLVSGIADVVSTGALAVGLNSDNLESAQKAVKVMRHAENIKSVADITDKLQSLDISKDAKKIAGKKAEILKWKQKEEMYILTVKVNKKKYEIYLKNAILTSEVKLID